MDKAKKHLFSIFIIAITSQIYLMLFVNGFAVSAGIITFFLIYYFYRDLNPLVTGIFAGLMVCILRVLVSVGYGGELVHSFISHFPEAFFYVAIGIATSFFKKTGFLYELKMIFPAALLTDIFANGTEMFIRRQIGIIDLGFNVVIVLVMVAVFRSLIIWFVLNVLKYYKILILNKENAEKYRQFLMMSSGLRTEIYLMEKNMDYIEKVMTQTYDLYEKIRLDTKRETWRDQAINIAKNVHEIKKDYSLVLHGLKSITSIGSNEGNMHFHHIARILDEGIRNLMQGEKIDGKIEIDLGENFLTSSHFYLISIFRNILVNSVDALTSRKDGWIRFIHTSNEGYHIFTIEDNGEGISEEELKYIFSPGFSTKIDYETGNINRGLGLSIAKDITEKKLKGKIKVSSRLGVGTKFVITIPRKHLEVGDNEYLHIRR